MFLMQQSVQVHRCVKVIFKPQAYHRHQRKQKLLELKRYFWLLTQSENWPFHGRCGLVFATHTQVTFSWIRIRKTGRVIRVGVGPGAAAGDVVALTLTCTHLLMFHSIIDAFFSRKWRDFATLGKLCDLPWPYLIAHHMGENFPLVDCIQREYPKRDRASLHLDLTRKSAQGGSNEIL